MAIEQSHKPFQGLVRDSIDDERVERILDGISRRRNESGARTRSIPTFVPIAVAAGVVVLIVIAVAMWGGDESSDSDTVVEPGPIAVVDLGQLRSLEASGEDGEDERFELSDGSAIELARGTALTARENTGQRVHLRLSAGRAIFDIVPGGPRRWSIDAGLATVEVLGTEFTIVRGAARVTASVSRGRIRVESELLEGGRRVLEAGQSLEIEHASPREVETAPQGDAEASSDEEPEVAASVDAGHSRRSWSQLAREGDYRAAYELLGGDGIRREMSDATTMSELLSLADIARLSGHAREAVEPLHRAIDRYPTDRRAAVAAFTLGRLEADVLRRHGRAARAFEQCLHLGAPRALREDVYARLAEVHAQNGDYSAARRAARDYLRQYPEGQRAEELRQWIQPR